MGKAFGVTGLLVLIAGCAGIETEHSIIPDRLNPAANESLTLIVPAKGVQIYECREKKEAPGAFEWTFIAPQADLYDTTGARIGRHFAGPSWESRDGSKVVGTLQARAEAPAAGSIPWLLLGTKSVASDGAFSKVTSIQRLNTVGGAAPKVGCSEGNAGTPVRVPYTADYYFFTAR